MRNLALVGLVTFVATAASAQQQPPPAQAAASCHLAALNQGARVRPDTEFYVTMQEQAGYWLRRLESVEPDAGRRSTLLADGKTILDGQLRAMGYMQGMMYVGSVLSTCRDERARLEATAPNEQKPAQ